MFKTKLGLALAAAVVLTMAFRARADDDARKAFIEQATRDLGSSSPDVREAAEVKLYSQGSDALVLIQAAAKRPDLPPAAAAPLQSIIDRMRSWNGARIRALRRRDETWRWNERTALAAYDAVGKKNPKWNDLAREGIRRFVAPDGQPAAREPLEKAIEAGCDDPLILYFEARVASVLQTNDPRSLENLFAIAGRSIEKSGYPADRKCFAMLRYCDFVLRGSVGVQGNEFAPEISQRLDEFMGASQRLWPQVVQEEGITAETLNDLASLVLQVVGGKHEDRKPYFDELYGPLAKTFPRSILPLVFKGDFYASYAWDARGRGFANTVTPEGWKLFGERLDVAEEALTKAWEMDPNDPAAATRMLTVELGQGKGREVMETWFARAMKANPDSRDACFAKLYYLEPKWYGDAKLVLAFGRECRDSKNWYATLPFLLITAHQELVNYAPDKAAYYRDPVVWQDLQSVYRPYLLAFPERAEARNYYAFFACQCGQWSEARRQFDLLGDKVIPAVFGGTVALNSVRQTAMAGGKTDAP